jgi:hypothetical protein
MHFNSNNMGYLITRDNETPGKYLKISGQENRNETESPSINNKTTMYSDSNNIGYFMPGSSNIGCSMTRNNEIPGKYLQEDKNEAESPFINNKSHVYQFEKEKIYIRDIDLHWGCIPIQKRDIRE